MSGVYFFRNLRRMANGIDATKSVETEAQSVEKALQEWRKWALNRDVAPNKIDTYLLGIEDVPQRVKELIQKLQETEAAQEQTPRDAQGEVVTRPMPESQPTKEHAGEFDMLNASSQIEEMKQEALSGEERARVSDETRDAAEQAQPDVTPQKTDTIAAPPASRVSEIQGYKPSRDVAQNAADIAEKGPVEDSRTWQASLLERLRAMWGDLWDGIFSS